MTQSSTAPQGSPPVPAAQGLARISEREADVLAALGEHLSNAQIASRLHLSVRTVETHVSSLLRKLGVADRRALAALAPSLGAADSGAGTVRGLPVTWTPFIGRSRERAQVVAALRESRLVTLLGPGGAGKTRLAAVVAEELAHELPLGATFVELVSTRPGFVVQTLAAALNVTDRPGQQLRDTVVDRLRPGRSLLVLDNCEHVLDEAADVIGAVLSGAPDVLVLATSRERVGVVGERVVPLPGLSLVDDRTGGAAESEAVALFFDRARALDAGFAADPSVVGALCAQLDGMPLAIELATARTVTLGIAGLQAGLSDRLRLLSGGRSVDERHRSLRTVLDWSHDLLDDEERVALRRLGRFAGPFDLPAAEAVTALPMAELADLVGRLGDKSLVTHRSAAAAEGWTLLETVRAYALEKLADAGELTATDERYVAWALNTARELEARLEAGDDSWLPAFDARAADLRAALAVAVDDSSASSLAGLLGHLSYGRRSLGEARRHYSVAAQRAVTDREAAAHLRSAAGVAQTESDGKLRFDLSLAAAERAAADGDHATQAMLLAGAVELAMRFPATFANDIPLEQLQELQDTAERVAPLDDPATAAQVALGGAWLDLLKTGRPDRRRFEDAFEAARRADEPTLLSSAYDAFGTVHIMGGQFRRNQELSVERLGLLDRLPTHMPGAGPELQDVLHMGVENAVAAGEITEALRLSELFTDRRAVATSPTMIISKPIVPLVLIGRFDEALDRGLETRAAWERAGSPSARWMAPSMYAVVMCLALRGDDDRADEWREFAGIRIAGEQSRNVHFQVGGIATFVESRLALHRGDFDAATRAVAEIPLEADAWWHVRHYYLDAYPWAIAADVAAAAGDRQAETRIAAAAPVAEQNPWAAACVARARFRLHGAASDFAESVAGWERVGARYERACTLLLSPERAAEGEAELADLGLFTAPPA